MVKTIPKRSCCETEDKKPTGAKKWLKKYLISFLVAVKIKNNCYFFFIKFLNKKNLFQAILYYSKLVSSLYINSSKKIYIFDINIKLI